MASAISGSAIFSTCGLYRYLLTRHFDDEGHSDFGLCEPEKMATFIMLNPSTADATRNDPTIRKCSGFARRWQCSTMQVLNLFAVRATLPNEMKRAADPVGPDNLEWFARALAPSIDATHLVICAWGVHGAHLGQDRTILRWLNEQEITALAFGFTRGGYPRHPLYLPYSAELVEFRV